MDSRRFREVYVLQRKAPTVDGYGQPTETWTNLEVFRGYVWNKYSREFNRYNMQESKTDSEIRCRNLVNTATPMDRIQSEDGSRTYNIVGVPFQDRQKGETVFIVQEQPYHAL